MSSDPGTERAYTARVFPVSICLWVPKGQANRLKRIHDAIGVFTKGCFHHFVSSNPETGTTATWDARLTDADLHWLRAAEPDVRIEAGGHGV